MFKKCDTIRVDDLRVRNRCQALRHGAGLSACQVGPRQVPGSPQLGEVLWWRRAVVGSAVLSYERRNANVQRSALIHDWHPYTAQRFLREKGLTIRRQ